jgi:hypothetical protein
MWKFLLLLPVSLFSATCNKSKILGVFPKIHGMNCSDYALFIGLVGIVSALLFWHQVTK